MVSQLVKIYTENARPQTKRAQERLSRALSTAHCPHALALQRATSAAEAFEAGYGRQRVASVDEEVDDEDRKDRATDHEHEGAERDNICRRHGLVCRRRRRGRFAEQTVRSCIILLPQRSAVAVLQLQTANDCNTVPPVQCNEGERKKCCGRKDGGSLQPAAVISSRRLLIAHAERVDRGWRGTTEADDAAGGGG